MPLQKLYCYVDETGQDTKGQFFLVAVIILGQEREELKKDLERIEQTTGKRELRWQKTQFTRRKNYLELALANPHLKGEIFFTQFSGIKYPEFTITAITKAVKKKVKTRNYELTVLIEGLKREERRFFASGLRHQGIRVKKVRGLRQESDAIIRLADSLAGFLRDVKKGEAWTQDLFKRISTQGIIEEV